MDKTCASCGMPLIGKDDYAGGDPNAAYCVHCVNEDGSVKACEEVFEGGVQFFMQATGADRASAERITRRNMRQQPHWADAKSGVLEGEAATDGEFAEALRKL